MNARLPTAFFALSVLVFGPNLPAAEPAAPVPSIEQDLRQLQIPGAADDYSWLNARTRLLKVAARPEVFATLLKALRDDPLAERRSILARDMAAVNRALKPDDPRVREVLSALEQRGVEDADWHVRVCAMLPLTVVRGHDEESLRILRRVMDDPEPVVRDKVRGMVSRVQYRIDRESAKK